MSQAVDPDEKESECIVCGGAQFQLSDGLFFCSECGTQSQDVREEVAEETEHMTGVRTYKGSTAKKKAPVEAEDVKEVSFLEKIQTILLLQCDALIKLGFDKSVKEAVKCLCLLYLKHFGYAFQDRPASSLATSPFSASPRPCTATISTFSNPLPVATPTSLKDHFTTPTFVKSLHMTTHTHTHPVAHKRLRLGGRACTPSSVTTHLITPTSSKTSSIALSIHSRNPGSRKRLRLENKEDGPSFSPKKSKLTLSRPPQVLLNSSKAEDLNEDLSDSCLFETTQEDLCDDGSSSIDAEDKHKEEERGTLVKRVDRKDLFGDELYLFFKSKDPRRLCFFTIRFTVSLLYLGLLFTNQNVLLCDITRLVAMNKIPYHNLHMLLPNHITAGKSATLRTYGRYQVTSDKLHRWSLSLYKSLPLPILPFIDPKTVCHTLLDRLVLPLCFRGIVDRALIDVYWPEHHKLMDVGTHLQQRLDVECLALIVVMLKLVYRLDDAYEFEQSSQGVSGAGCQDDGKSVYVWEDWVALLCRHMQKRLDKSVPLTARELEYVSDYQNYLDLCRQEIFPKVRPVKTSGERHRIYNPEHFAKVSAIFGEHLKNLRAKESANQSQSSEGGKERYTWDTFTPRMIPLSALKKDGDICGPWSRYLATPGPAASVPSSKAVDRVSNSMLLLLQLCSDVVDVEVRKLLQWVSHVEWTIIRTHAVAGVSADTPSSADNSSDTSSPAGDSSDTSSPAGDSSDTSSPAGDSSDTSSPADNSSDTSSPAGNSSDTSSPAGDSSDTSSPADNSSDTSSPAGDSSDTSSPAGDSPDTSLPADI